MQISVLILTLNEEINLERCLSSLEWCNDLVVLDSKSTDKTQEIAASHGARIIEREFDNYASQRNFGINEISYNNPWLLMIDADEVTPSELVEEIKHVLSNTDEQAVLFRMRRKDYLFGRWIKNSSKYPVWFGRLLKIGKVRVEREINEEYHADGKVGFLQQHLHHYPFNKGFSAWFEKHNRYSSMEADLKMQNESIPISWKNVIKNDPAIRRKGLKALLHNLPARPFLIFFGLYFLRLGMLEGKAGLTYCLLTSFYEYMIDIKCKELNFKKKGLPV